MTRSLLAIITLFATTAAPPPVQLLRAGSFHGDEVTAKSSEHWLALTGDGKQFALREVVVSVHRVVDEDPKERTGRDVSIKPELEALAVIRGANLKAGPVVTAAAQLEIGRDESRQITLGAGSPYVARVTCSATGC